MRHISILAFSLFFLITSCTQNKARINDDLKKHFDAAGVEGSFALWNNQSGNITIYNMTTDTTRVSPGASFRVVNSLIGIEAGVITDDKMVIKWDGNENVPQEWKRDMSLKEAFQLSATPYFQEVSRKIGKDTMQSWLDTLQYGNKVIGGAVDSFWLNNSLKITPDEQLGLVYKLYFDKLPFSRYAQNLVKGLMLQEENKLYNYYLASGSATGENGSPAGWAIGFIEENRHVYLFSLYIQNAAADMDMKKKSEEVTKAVLEDLGYFKGQK